MKAGFITRAIVVALASLAALPAPVSAEEPSAAELDAIREALAKYKDPYVAVRDL